MTVTKIYRYKIREGAWDEFIALQKQSDALYRSHVSYDVRYVQSHIDPTWVSEIHVYPDKETALKTEDLLNTEPRLLPLFQKFLALLDPEEPDVEEFIGDTYSIR